MIPCGVPQDPTPRAWPGLDAPPIPRFDRQCLFGSVLALALLLGGCGEGGREGAPGADGSSGGLGGPGPASPSGEAGMAPGPGLGERSPWWPAPFEVENLTVRSPGCEEADPGCARVSLSWPRFLPVATAPSFPTPLLLAEAWIADRLREQGLLEGGSHPTAEAMAQAFVAEHDAFRSEFPESALAGWALEREIEVRHADAPALVLEAHEFAWTGGAHPNSWRRGWAVTIPGGDVIDLAFLFEPDDEPAVIDLLAAAFREDRGLPPGAPLSRGGLFEDELPLLENLLPDAEGLVVIYSPYAIAPHAMGEIRVRLAWDGLLPLLRPEARQALAPWLPG